MGRGPEHLLARGLVDGLGGTIRARIERIEAAQDPPPAEIQTAFALSRALADGVRRAVSEGAWPLVLAGNCNTAVGTLAGLGSRDTGVIWFDAHGDFNTPETSVSGFLDGMALAMVTGRCWRTLAETVPGFRPVPEDNVVLVGARDLDPAEADLLEGSAVHRVSSQAIRAHGLRTALEPALLDLRRRVRRFYVHVDLDVLEPREARVNQFAAPDGLTVADAALALRLIRAQRPVAGAAFTAYDPSVDTDERVPAAARALLDALLEEAPARAGSSHLAPGVDS